MTKMQIRTQVPRAARFIATGCCGVLLLLLSACGSSDQVVAPPPEAAVKASASASAPADSSNPLAGMVKAVPAAGNQPVELRFDLPKQPVLGEPFDINLNVLGLADASGLELTVTAQPKVEVIAGGQGSLGALKTGESVQHTLQLRTSVAGISVIDVQLVAMVEGHPATAAFAIPVALADASGAAVATAGK